MPRNGTGLDAAATIFGDAIALALLLVVAGRVVSGTLGASLKKPANKRANYRPFQTTRLLPTIRNVL